ncbi:MAG: class I SAM-dependent methyltransferase [Pseudomonadota bacterium]
MMAACPLCGAACPHRFTRGEFRIFRCAPCDFEFVHPIPPPEALEATYGGEYFQGAGHGYGDYFEAERAVTLRKAAQRLDRLERLGLRRGARLLDVGCASGVFLEAAVERGLDARGVEPSAAAVAHARASVRDRIHDTLEAAAAHAPYQAITFWDVLEHLPSFIDTLAVARSLLAPHGWVGVVVPVIDNANARFFPTTWDQYKPPEHLWYFSRRSLRAVLSKHIGPVRFEEPAWIRRARLFDVAWPARGRLAAAARALEAAVTSAALVALRLPRALRIDSMAMYAERA